MKIFALLPLFILISCAGMNNLPRPTPISTTDSSIVTVNDGTNIFVYTFNPILKSSTTIYIITGYTGINHNRENDIIRLLSNYKNRIVVIHPRGTGYSEGIRGDVTKYSNFLEDYIEIINQDINSRGIQDKVILYGHSISTAIALKISSKIEKVDGIILVNPPYKMKSSKGMTPKISDYIKYAGYMVFSPHTPIVNMAGDPKLIENSEEQAEAEIRSSDPLLVKYISMYMMVESKKLLDNMVKEAKLAKQPLLLVYGLQDSIVEKLGCDEIYNNWGNTNKQYEIIENGPHGKLTVILAKDKILDWIEKH